MPHNRQSARAARTVCSVYRHEKTWPLLDASRGRQATLAPVALVCRAWVWHTSSREKAALLQEEARRAFTPTRSTPRSGVRTSARDRRTSAPVWEFFTV